MSNPFDGLRYLDRLPKTARYRGDASAGEIEIVAPAAGEHAGMVYEDDFHTVIRDVVRYPSGKKSAQLRVLGRTDSDGPEGVVALAVYGERLVLRKMFRHGTRSWEIEAVGGRREDGQTVEDAARREIEQELGRRAATVEILGEVAPVSSLLGSTVAIVWAVLSAERSGQAPESGEAMGPIVELTADETMEAIARGDIRVGETLSAILLALAAKKLRLRNGAARAT